AVPIGGVIMWWGTVDAIPDGFELCDGTAPTTPGAVLTGRKPDLVDRFAKGAGASDSTVAQLEVGGAHAITTRNSGGTAITPSQLPAYSLPHNLGTTSAGNHRHVINNNTQDGQQKGASDDGGTSNDNYFALGD